MSRQRFANAFRATLTLPATNSDTTLHVSGTSGLPTLGVDEYLLLSIGTAEDTREIIKVTAFGSDTLTAARAHEGIARAWPAGAQVTMTLTAETAQRFEDGQLAALAGQGLDYFADSQTVYANSSTPIYTLKPTLDSPPARGDVRLQVIGYGAFILRPTPGNLVGQYAVDLQMSYTTNAQVASGYASHIGGGDGNTASGDYSTVGGGRGGTASSIYSTVGGGASCQATQVYSAVAGGRNVRAQGEYAFAGAGYYTLAQHNYSTVTGGFQCYSSGEYATVGGGYQVRAAYCATATGGYNNNASGYYSAIPGGRNNTASGEAATAYGEGCTASSYNDFAGGYYATASGGPSFSFGNNTTANGWNSWAAGSYSTTRGMTGKWVYASGPFSITGDAQDGLHVLRRKTTNATPAELTSNNNSASSSNIPVLPDNSAFGFRAQVCALSSGNAAAYWEIKGLIKRASGAATTVLVNSSVSKLFEDAAASTWSIALSAETTLGGLKITATGQASTTINWVCTLDTVETAF